MASKQLRALKALDLEERVLNAGSVVSLVGVFLPWMSGALLGDTDVTYRGYEFYTSFIGGAVILLQAFILAVTVGPMFTGKPLVQKQHKEWLRTFAAGQSFVLLLAALSVLTNVTFEFSRVRMRYGIYVALIGAIFALIYAFLKLQQQRRLEMLEHFGHPEDRVPPPPEPMAAPSVDPALIPPPPPPPPPLEPEEHRLR